MRRFCLRGLFLSSLLGWLVTGCSPVTGYHFVKTTTISNSIVPPVIDSRGYASLYKANIKVFNKRYSGLMVLKQTDRLISHITFVSEIGMKIFDYELNDTTFKLAYIFAPLNKPAILKLLESDMKLLVLYRLYHGPVKSYTKGLAATFVVKNGSTTDYYAADKFQTVIKTITRKGRLFKKEKIRYVYNDSLAASGIKLKHKGLIRVKMNFKLLKTNPTQSQDDEH